ncbi:peroxiredoxin family protein [Micromonospora zhanjiangensis]|uniref:Peroxiredoxin family protein n=1 Tax=Micromonospora zhanjiangensis TaxID=1522057 RepID=A0ABV8KPN7_9ACTN
MLHATAGLVSTLLLINLLLMFGVIRRLREHTNLLAEMKAARPTDVVASGSRVADFATVDIAGNVVSRELLSAGTVVAFFSSNCGFCDELLPKFVHYAAGSADGGAELLAVVSGDDTGRSAFVEKLAPVARVVTEAFDGATTKAFGVTAFPMIFVMANDGVVASSDIGVDALQQRRVPAMSAG